MIHDERIYLSDVDVTDGEIIDLKSGRAVWIHCDISYRHPMSMDIWDAREYYDTISIDSIKIYDIDEVNEVQIGIDEFDDQSFLTKEESDECKDLCEDLCQRLIENRHDLFN